MVARKRKQPAKPVAKHVGGMGVFDKKTAVRVVDVPIPGPGVYEVGEDVTLAERVWMEWTPSAALIGASRRAFLSKKGIIDPSMILTDSGIQVPRKGMSCRMTDRRVVVLGQGKLKFWVESERANDTTAARGRELPSALLQLVAPTNTIHSSSEHQRTSSSVSTPAPRRRDDR